MKQMAQNGVRLFALFDALTEAVYVVDSNWRCLYSNQEAMRLLGSENLVGKNIWDLFPQAQAALLYTEAHRVMEEQQPASFDIYYLALQSWFECHLYPSSEGFMMLLRDVTEQKAQKRLPQSQARVSHLIDTNIIGVIIANEQHILEANDAFLAMVGYTREDVETGRLDWLAMTPPEFASVDEQALRELYERGTCTPFEKAYYRRDGSQVPILMGATELEKDPVQWVCFIVDITDRKRVEARQQFLTQVSKVLSSSLDYQETLANIARLVVPRLADWFTVDLVDDAGHFELLEIAHIDPEQVKWARTLRELYPIDPQASTGIPQVIRSGQSELYAEISDALLEQAARNEEELAILRQIGYSSAMLVPLVARGQTLGVVTFVSTTSGRCYDEQDLALAEEVGRQAGVALDNARLYREVVLARDQLEAILKNAGEGITMHDAKGTMLYANDVAARMTGFPSAEAMVHATLETYQQTLARFVVKDEAGHQLTPRDFPGRRALQEGRSLRTLLQYYNTQTGRTSWSLIKSQPIFQDGGEAQLVVNVIVDVSEQQALEQRKNEFISMASHELKTPVTSLKGFTNVLLRRLSRQGDEQNIHYLNRMDAQINRLTRLISDLLDISRMQSGKLALREEPFELGVLVEEIVGNVQATTSTHQLLIEGRAEAQVLGDPERLGQVFVNLLTNAIKYSPSANKVVVRLERDDPQGQIIVSVQDFGIGIDQAHHEHIFERFYQVTDPEEKTYPGLGIGLYISSEIVARHHGRLWVESRKGQGATFFVALPLLSSKGR